jgi:hypothetical protein
MYQKSQIAYSIHDGRYNANAPRSTVGLPVELFNSAFGYFLDDIRCDGGIPDDFVRSVIAYMQATSANYPDELTRRATLTPLLNSILGCNIQTVENDDGTRPDGILEGHTLLGMFILLLKEDKNELGDGQSDPSRQAILSAARTWVQAKVCDFYFLFIRKAHSLIP